MSTHNWLVTRGAAEAGGGGAGGASIALNFVHHSDEN